MVKYSYLLLALHTLYVLYLFAVSYAANFSDELQENFDGLIKLNCFIYIGWLPLYLNGWLHVY